MSQEICPNCGQPADHLIPVEGGLRARMVDVLGITDPPSHVCDNCKDELKDTMSQGALLRQVEKQRAEQREHMWKHRVSHVKLGRQFMQKKMFSEAAVEYEKYLRILEIVLDAESGGLNEKHFKTKLAKKEITVVASIYWDLMVIYDSSPRYGARLHNASKKLKQFARFTPVFPDIIRRASNFKKKSKNPDVFKEFVMTVQEDRPRCFIAGCVYPSGHMDIVVLRAYRDAILRNDRFGRGFTAFYYRNARPVTQFLDRFPILKAPVRAVLRLATLAVKCRLVLAKHDIVRHR